MACQNDDHLAEWHKQVAVGGLMLEKMTLGQLRQICVSLGLPRSGTKQKIIEHLKSTGRATDDFLMSIDTEKKYFIKCDGYNVPKECVSSDGMHLWYCNRHSTCDSHVYYDNISKTEGKPIAGGHKTITAKCNICNCVSPMDEYKNEFIGVNFDEIKKNSGKMTKN